MSVSLPPSRLLLVLRVRALLVRGAPARERRAAAWSPDHVRARGLDRRAGVAPSPDLRPFR